MEQKNHRINERQLSQIKAEIERARIKSIFVLCAGISLGVVCFFGWVSAEGSPEFLLPFLLFFPPWINSCVSESALYNAISQLKAQLRDEKYIAFIKRFFSNYKPSYMFISREKFLDLVLLHASFHNKHNDKEEVVGLMSFQTVFAKKHPILLITFALFFTVFLVVVMVFFNTYYLFLVLFLCLMYVYSMVKTLFSTLQNTKNSLSGAYNEALNATIENEIP
ncbi:MAG TPA: hypothetical protein PK581_02870 [Caldisericia bacterium]|nr:hypothetical protein [Caldisericia bacterium]